MLDPMHGTAMMGSGLRRAVSTAYFRRLIQAGGLWKAVTINS